MGFLALFSLLLISGVRAGPCTPSADKEVVASNTTTGAYAWFTGYNDVNLSDVNITKYDALIYSFVIPTNDTSKLDVGGSDADIKMHDFVETVTSDGVEAWVSIGGWGGSRYFSPAVATSENRTLFVAATLNLTETYGFTGIDFDWEYPSSDNGHTCNQRNDNDTVNFLSFLRQLRQDDRASNLSITAAVPVTPFENAEKEDILAFSEVLDHISIMNYDNYGSWTSTTGPNAPLDNNGTCTGHSEPEGSSASASVKAWTDAGFPIHQIVLGVPAYGYQYHNISRDDVLNETQGFNYYIELPEFDLETIECDVPEKPPSDNRLPSTIEFSKLYVDYLADLTTLEDMNVPFDNCTQTPFLYDEENSLMISYDDEDSFEKKGEFIREHGLKGFAMWHVNGDYNSLLVDAISHGMGRPS